MVPFKKAELEGKLYTEARVEYQKKMTGARSCVEQCNAQIKGKWR